MAPFTPVAFAAKYDLSLDLVQAVFQKIADGEAIVLAVSGKLGAGKDSVAPNVLKELGIQEVSHEFFAKALKDEVNVLIEYVQTQETAEAVAKTLEEEMNVPFEQGLIVAKAIWEDVKNGVVKDSKNRTDSSRFVLQYWGTEIRRAQDEDYWVKKSLVPIMERLESGVSVYATDARFENEVDSLEALGAFTLRLKVSKDVQAARILARDGILPSEAAINHVSETALDAYESADKFDLVIDTDKLSRDEVVAETLAEVRLKRSRR